MSLGNYLPVNSMLISQHGWCLLVESDCITELLLLHRLCWFQHEISPFSALWTEKSLINQELGGQWKPVMRIYWCAEDTFFEDPSAVNILEKQEFNFATNSILPRTGIVSWSTFFVYGRCYRRSPAHNRLSHILEKNEVPDTLNGVLVKYEDATIIIPDSTLPFRLAITVT